jgi:hypothetical protein
MKLLNKIMIGFTTLLVGSTVLCGFSLKCATTAITAEAVNFHVEIAATTMVFTLLTIALLARSGRIAKI